MTVVTTPPGLTIDELARQVGMTVRNVRAHQARGLLPPPDVRGRTGFYGDEHVARLELIKDMQADGFNLRAVAHALKNLPPGTDADVLDFRRALVEPWSAEEPEIVTSEELDALFGDDQALRDEAVKLGLLHSVGDDRYEAPSPALLRAGAEVSALGVPPAALMQTQRELVRHADNVARLFVKVYLDNVWRPFREAGQPEDQWPAVRDALARMAPLASTSLLATFRLAMEHAVEKAMTEELGRDQPKPRRRR